MQFPNEDSPGGLSWWVCEASGCELCGSQSEVKQGSPEGDVFLSFPFASQCISLLTMGLWRLFLLLDLETKDESKSLPSAVLARKLLLLSQDGIKKNTNKCSLPGSYCHVGWAALWCVKHADHRGSLPPCLWALLIGRTRTMLDSWCDSPQSSQCWSPGCSWRKLCWGRALRCAFGHANWPFFGGTCCMLAFTRFWEGQQIELIFAQEYLYLTLLFILVCLTNSFRMWSCSFRC